MEVTMFCGTLQIKPGPPPWVTGTGGDWTWESPLLRSLSMISAQRKPYVLHGSELTHSSPRKDGTDVREQGKAGACLRTQEV